jgi:glucokinase
LSPTVGTGISGGLVLGGRIYRGATAVRDGDPAAIGAVETWAEHVCIGVASAINTFDPNEVALGGGGARAAELLLEPVRRAARSYAVPGLGRNTRIRLARHGARAGVLGAGLLALHELQP